MKQKLSLSLVGFTLSSAGVLAVSPVIPERQPAERYQKMSEDSPFSLATPTAPVPEKVDGPFTNFFVAGLGKGTDVNGKEQVFVGISSRDKTVSFSLLGNEKGHDDISVEGIVWDETVGKSKVTLKKGNEIGTIGFDEMALKTPSGPPPGLPPRGGAAPIPGVPNTNAARNLIRPPTLNAAPAVPRPTAVPQLPQAAPAANPAGQANPAPDQAGGRPRVRVIRSNP